MVNLKYFYTNQKICWMRSRRKVLKRSSGEGPETCASACRDYTLLHNIVFSLLPFYYTHSHPVFSIISWCTKSALRYVILSLLCYKYSFSCLFNISRAKLCRFYLVFFVVLIYSNHHHISKSLQKFLLLL